jgi:hypothetical protein
MQHWWQELLQHWWQEWCVLEWWDVVRWSIPVILYVKVTENAIVLDLQSSQIQE